MAHTHRSQNLPTYLSTYLDNWHMLEYYFKKIGYNSPDLVSKKELD